MLDPAIGSAISTTMTIPPSIGGSPPPFVFYQPTGSFRDGFFGAGKGMPVHHYLLAVA